MSEQPEIGLTGRFPNGKLCDNDLGELAMAIQLNTDLTMLKLDFGGLVAWVALPKGQVLELAAILAEVAEKMS